MTSTLRLPFLSAWTQADHPARLALLLRERFEAAAKRSFGATRVLLARSRYRIKWFRLTGVPVAERFAALAMQARAWAPFESSSYRLNIQGDEGFVVAWDSANVANDLASAGIDAQRCHFVPESLLRGPGVDGARLVRCAEGVEGQVWRDGWLTASRWWPELPDAAEWLLFLHASACEPGERPVPLDMALATRPWAALQGLDSGDAIAADKASRLLLLGGLAVALATGFVGRQAWDVRQETRQREAQIAGVRGSGADALRSRDQAMRAQGQAQQWANWLSTPQPIEVIAAVHEALGKSGVIVKDLELSGDRLRLALQLSPQAQRSSIVRDLQAGGWFKGVSEARVEMGRGLMVIDMRIDGLRPPARVADVAANPSPKLSDQLPPAFPAPAGFEGKR